MLVYPHMNLKPIMSEESLQLAISKDKIAEVEIFFDNVDTLRSWARALVQAVALQSSLENKGNAKSSEQAELGHVSTGYQQESAEKIAGAKGQ
jgi:hypothetical protein